MANSFNCINVKEIEEPSSKTDNNDNDDNNDTIQKANVLDCKVYKQPSTEHDSDVVEIKIEPDKDENDLDPLYAANLLEVEINVGKETIPYPSSESTKTRLDVNISKGAPLNPISSPNSLTANKSLTYNLPIKSRTSFKKSLIIGSSTSLVRTRFPKSNVEIKANSDEEEEVQEHDPLYAVNFLKVEVTEPENVSIPLTAQMPRRNESKKVSQPNTKVSLPKRYCNSVSGLTIHKSLTHKESLTPCEKSTDQKFVCSICKKEYKYKRGLTNHMKKHVPFKLTCNICEGKFASRVALKKHHREEHPGVKPHPCPVCGKRYNQKYHLTYHLRVHSGDKPFSCETCQQSFTSKNILMYHLRLHTGDKRYSCDYCEKRFIKKCALTNHLRVHTGDKPFSCDICKKCFNQRSTLTDHLRGHRGEKRMLSCEVCNKLFYYRSHLNRHLSVHNAP